MIKGKKLFSIIAFVLLVAMCSVIFAGCEKKNNNENTENKAYLEPLDYYFTGIKNKDLETHLKAYPSFANKADLITLADIEDLYKSYEAQYGPNINIEYKFGDAIKLGTDEVAEIVGEIVEAYEEVKREDITEIYEVPITVTIEGDGIEQPEGVEGSKTNGTEQHSFFTFKYKDAWYTI